MGEVDIELTKEELDSINQALSKIYIDETHF
jgi:hypothetical protein